MEEVRGRRLVIRADANTEIGTGHVMRCLALGQAWKEMGGQVTFVTSCQEKAILTRLETEGFEMHVLEGRYLEKDEWPVMEYLLDRQPRPGVVLDGYHFDEEYQKRIKSAGYPLLVIDDMAHLEHYYADLLLNQNFGSELLQYKGEPCTRLLLGTRYALIRKEFLVSKDRPRHFPVRARKLLVTMGGSDQGDNTLRVLKALGELGDGSLEIIVVAGASYSHMATLDKALCQTALSARVVHDATNMPDLMAEADMAIAAAGSTTWELMLMGLPSVLVIAAGNQVHTALSLRQYMRVMDASKAWDEKGFLGHVEDVINSRNLREAMSLQGRSLVDGDGARRVVSEFLFAPKAVHEAG